MRNRPFALPLSESDWLIKRIPSDWGSLKNRFSGRRLFKLNYFNLLNGDMSVLGNKNVRWLIENVLSYSASNKDKNLIPVLKKIAADKSFEEGFRQRSAEILEMPWASKDSAYGERKPQTSEILKLIKGRSIESKRQAICMIGKYKLADLLLEVSEGLNYQGLEVDAEAVLRSFGSESGNSLQGLYLKYSGNISTSMVILRILSHHTTIENSTFIYERLWSNSKEIKEAALRCLLDIDFKVPQEQIVRLNDLIHDVAGTLLWFLSSQVCLRNTNDEFLSETINKEILQWKKILYSLISVGYRSGNVRSFNNMVSGEESDIPAGLIDLIFTGTKKPLLGFIPGFSNYEKKLKQFHQFFWGEIPDYRNLIEDLLNLDYNRISIWTKACTLRSIKIIENDSLRESVVALLFSPHEILQEEAAKLIARTNGDLYRSASQRIPSLVKIRLDKIVNNETEEEELLFNKTKFLSTLFPDIPEDKLLFTVKEMKYLRRIPAEYQLHPGGIILWSFLPDLTFQRTVKVIFVGDPQFDKFGIPSGESVFYLLNLETIEEFNYLYPEHSYEILKYIDDNEE
jgi:hypothetical protein